MGFDIYFGNQKFSGSGGANVDLSDYVTKEEFDASLGDISSALNAILGSGGGVPVPFMIDTGMAVSINDILYHDGRFIAVGNKCLISENGFHWESFDIPITASAICYGDGKYVCVPSTGATGAYSEDGITWHTVSLGSANQAWKGLCYGNGKFITTATNLNLYSYSEDGLTWTQAQFPTDVRSGAITYGDGKFVVGNTSIASDYGYYSEDGITWIQFRFTTNRQWKSIVYGNGKFVAVGLGYGFNCSDDGITWYHPTLNTTANWIYACYGDGVFTVLSQSSKVLLWSRDGNIWNNIFIPSNNDAAIASGNGLIVVANSANNMTIVYPYMLKEDEADE